MIPTAASSPYALPIKYTNVRALSPGKNGDVYCAYDTITARTVFLKVYAVDKLDQNSALREPQTLQSLKHSALVQIFSADRLPDNRILLEMEYVPQGTFATEINRATASGRWLGVHEILRLMMDVCDGLSYLHDKGFVHRDIKPANILVRSTNAGLRSVVTDLGLAATIDESGRAFASKHAKLYRPTEVWQGKGYSYASDIYQCGLVLYQMLGGSFQYRFGAMPDDLLAAEIKKGKLIDLETLPLSVPDGIIKLIDQCVGKEQLRPQRMTELLKKLQECKTKSYNWKTRFRPDGGSTLYLDGEHRQFKVRIVSTGDTHLVNCFKKVDKGDWRKFQSPVLVTNPRLRSCRKFLKAIRACEDAF